MRLEDLIMYVDGELDEEERVRVEAELAENPDWMGVLAEVCLQRFLLADVLGLESAARVPAPVGRTLWRFRAPVLAAAAGILVVAGVWWGWENGRRKTEDGILAKVVEKVSGVRCQVSGGNWVDLKVGEKIRAGETVVTAAGGYAALALADGSVVEMNGDTALAFGRVGRQTEMTLEKGDVYVQASKPMRFNPGRYDQAENSGTAFELSRASEGKTTLRVAQGQVQFGMGPAAVAVNGLQASQAKPDGVPSAPETVALAAIGAWSKAFAPGTIYDDNFDSDRLGSFWVKIAPRDRVSLKDGKLNVSVGSAGKRATRPARTELVSKPVPLGGRPVEIVLKRNKSDGPFCFLPIEGEPAASVELSDETGQPVCQATWKTFLFQPKRLLTGCFVAIGSEDRGNVAVESSPVALRIVVGSDGRVVVGQGTEESGNMVTLTEGRSGRPIRGISLRLCLSNRGAKEVGMRWVRMEARRLEAWPEWAGVGK